MELRQLEHFVVLAEELSFTKAARRMHIVQSGLSMSIRALEAEVGTALFDRGGRTVTLTPAGSAMLPEARRALSAVEAARQAVQATRGLLRGALTVGLAQFADGGRAAHLLGRFHAEHPGVSLRVFQGNAQSLFEGLRTGRFDVIIGGRISDVPTGISTIELARARYILVCPTPHPLAARASVRLADIDGQPFIDMYHGWVTREVTDAVFAAAGVKRDIVCEVDDIMLRLRMVQEGLGVAIQPHVDLHGVADVAFVPIEDPFPDWQLVAAHSGQQPANVAARVFLGMVLHEWLGDSTLSVAASA